MKKILLLALVFEVFCFNLSVFANEETIIKKIEVTEDTRDQLKVSIDYVYSGDEGKEVILVVAPVNGNKLEKKYSATPHMIKRHMKKTNNLKAKFTASKAIGKGKGNKEILLYRNRKKQEDFTSQMIQVNLVKKGELYPFYSKTIDYFKTWKAEEIIETTKKRHARLLSESIKLLDDGRLGGERVQLAKKKLERIILDDPKNIQAYLEMARVKMKEDTATRGHKNSNGVTQAKKLIEIALEIDDKYANTYILLGYVNTLEGNLSESIKHYKKAQSIGTKNMWLYSNWGRALEKANDKNGAIEIYKTAIALPLNKYRYISSLKSSNRAIPLIFSQLLSLQKESGNWEEVNNTYQQKLSVLDDACSFSEYANFRLKQYGDFEESIKLSKKTLVKRGCKQFARETLASSYLLKIAKSPSLSNEDYSNLYNKSLALMTNPIELISDLAGSKHTLPAIGVLSKKGININSKDTRNYTPLAYAIYQGDESSASSLISKGAKLNSLVSEKNLTHLMLAVAYNRENLVKLLITKGADTKVISEEGHTALSISKALGLKNIQRMLSSPKGA